MYVDHKASTFLTNSIMYMVLKITYGSKIANSVTWGCLMNLLEYIQSPCYINPLRIIEILFSNIDIKESNQIRQQPKPYNKFLRDVIIHKLLYPY